MRTYHAVLIQRYGRRRLFLAHKAPTFFEDSVWEFSIALPRSTFAFGWSKNYTHKVK